MNGTTRTPDLLEVLDANIWMNVLRLLIALNTMGTNAFLLGLFIRYKQLRNSQCNRLILLTAIMDLITGSGPAVRAIFQFYTISAQVHEYTKILCILVSLPYTFGYAGSQISFIGLALDRLFAVVRPLSYKGRKQKKFTYVIASLALIFMLLLFGTKFVGLDLSIPSKQCSTPLNSGPFWSTFWTLFIGISTLIVFCTYMAILLVFFHVNNNNNNTIVPSSTTANGGNNNDAATSHGIQSKEKQLTITVVLILLNYTISWTLPSAIWFAINFFDPTNARWLNYMSYVQGYMGAAGCGLNFYIYLYKHEEIQHCTRKMFNREQTDRMWTINTSSQQQQQRRWS